MKKPVDEELDKAISQAAKESGLPEDKIEELSSYMITYINTGAKYGMGPEGFARWYAEQGGKL